MRYTTFSASTDIGPSYCRIKFGSRYFTIDSVINVDERGISLDLMCSEEK
jgi:head-tail adaptor